MKGPLIFIASMPRSGSTLLAGMLTCKPYSIILSEPAFQRGELRDLNEYRKIRKINLLTLQQYQGQPRQMVRAFKEKVLPQILKSYHQVGIKECFLDNWRLFLEYFDPIKFIVLARDPRDIMLSTLDYSEHVDWHRKMWADQPTSWVAEQHYEVWRRQKEIISESPCFTLRYEDLCLGHVSFRAISEFCGLPFYEPSDVTRSILESYPFRAWEIKRHGDRISRKSVFRWKTETDNERLNRAYEFASLMGDYLSYWHYDD